MAGRIPFIWSNDDITNGKLQSMERQLAFLDRHGIKGTFFVVPCPQGGKVELIEDQPLVNALRDAKRAGHDPQQHTVTHHCIENGTADLRMYDLMGDEARLMYSTQRFDYEKLWELENLQANIKWGQTVWTEAFGEPSPGYRPGCGAFCANMYKALENLGFEWCSARLVSMTGWMWASGKWDYPIRFDGPARPWMQGNIMEFPILDDIAFRIPQNKVDAMVDLGWKMWEMCVQRNDPYLLVSHPFALEHEEGTGYQIHEKLIPRILDSGMAEPMTLHEYYTRAKAGEFPQAHPEEMYPDGSTLPQWHGVNKLKTRKANKIAQV